MKLQKYSLVEYSTGRGDWLTELRSSEHGNWVKASEAEGLEQENKRLNQVCSEKSSEIYRLRGVKLAAENRIKELESALCETCGDPRCEDSVVEHLKQKVARLRAALEQIKKNSLECFTCSASLLAENALEDK